MEKYEIHRRLGLGTFGHSFLVSNKLTKEYFVLKSIECKDEMHANDAFREAKLITEIKHPYIINFIDLFVYFDQERISFFFVLVMPYYSHGSSYSMLSKQWMQRQKSDEEELKKWLVQTLELLSVLRENHISHLNLKPENIFYNYEKNHVTITDFGLKCILDDKKRLIRSRPDDFMWIPEIMNRDVDGSKIDIWTLGMIIFAFMTTTVLTENEFYQILKSNRKYDVEYLREIMNNLYDFDFINLVTAMLDCNNESRPAVDELVEFSFFKDCFNNYSSGVVSRKNRQKITSIVRPIPHNNGVGAVVNYLNCEKNNEFCVQDALIWMYGIVRLNVNESLPNDYSQIIVDAININNENLKVCQCGVITLNYLAMFNYNPNHHLFSNSTIESIIKLSSIHPNDAKLHKAIAAFFIVLSSHPSASCRVGKLKVIQVLLESLKRFNDKASVVSVTLNAIWNLCVDQNNCETAIKYNARDIFVELYVIHNESPEVLLNGTASLLAIITSLDVQINPDNINIVKYLLETLIKHSGYRNLVKYTLVLLENLIEMNEEHGMEFLELEIETEQSKADYDPNNVKTLNGLDILIDIYKKHDDTSSLVLLICMVIVKIVSYEDLVDTILDLVKLKEFNDIIMNRFKHSRRLVGCTNTIFEKIKLQLNYKTQNE